MIICAGLASYLPGLDSTANGPFHVVDSAEEAIAADLLKAADVFLIGPGIPKPVHEIQKISAADKQLSVLLFAPREQLQQVRQAVNFAPFIGRNTLVIAITPDIDLKSLCDAAAARTHQKRSFFKLNSVTRMPEAATERVKLAKMGSFLEHAPIAAILLDETAHITNYNRQAKKLLPSLELLNVPLTRIFSEEQTVQINAFIQSDHDPEAGTELRVQQKIVELSSTVIYSDEGQKHFLLLLIDVTHERMEAARIRSILEALPQMAWITDAEGFVTYYTQAWYFYTGQSEKEALGEGWTKVVLREDLPRLAEQWAISVKTGKALQHASRYLNSKGAYRWHLVKATAIRDTTGLITMWVGTCTDIHDQIMLTEELERKVKERTRSLEASNLELEQYAQVASHDLQEPLRKIRTFADLLQRKVSGAAGKEATLYADKITETAARMSNLLTALLNYTLLKTEAQPEPTDLNEAVDHVLIDLELLSKQKGAIINVGTLPVIKAIPVQIQQLFYNLINNALKFSGDEVAPQIDISARPLLSGEMLRYPQLSRVKEYWEIKVSDNGIGFDQQYAEKIFGMFQRLHTSTEFEGTGIGLSLVKKVVHNHGGEIVVSSEPGAGTTFCVVLPA